MAGEEICFKYGSSLAFLKDFQDEAKAEIEKRHSLISSEEWGEIVSEFNLENYDEISFLSEKPTRATSGRWWETSTDIPINFGAESSAFIGEEVGVGTGIALYKYDPWGDFRDLILLDQASDDVGPTYINKLLVEVKQYFPVRWKDASTIKRDLTPEAQDAANEIDSLLNKLTQGLRTGNASSADLVNIMEDIDAQISILDSEGFTTPDLAVLLQVNLGTGIRDFDRVILQLSNQCGAFTSDYFDQVYENAILDLLELNILNEQLKNNARGLAADALRGGASLLENFSDIPGASFVGRLTEEFIARTGLENFTQLDELRQKLRNKIKQEIKEAFADNLIFSEQCFMLTNLTKIVEHKKQQPLAFSLPYQKNVNQNPDLCGTSRAGISSNLNQPLLVQGEPFSFMNKMAVEPSQRALFDIMPHQISSLTPNIELFKVVSEEFDGELVEFEIPIKFDINTKSPRIGDVYRSQRGTGVGLKSFKFSYDGTDPFSAKKAITADLSIFASSFTNLLEYRDQDGNTSSQKITGTSYRYTDLALKTGKISKSDNGGEISDAKAKTLEETFGDEEREQQEKLNFRLKVVVQWAAKPEFIRTIKDEKLKKALYNCAITLYLTPVIHTFDFDDNGGVTFNISYRAYIEDFFTNQNFDIFSELSSVKQTRKYLLDYFKEQNCDILKGKEFKNFQNFDSQFIINNNRKSFNSIIRGLHDRKLINYLNMTYGEIERWMDNPSAFKFNKLPISSGIDTQNTEAIVDEAIKNYESSADEKGKRDLGDLRLSLVANSQENQSIAFFYLSDLISVVMNLIEQDLLFFDDMNIIGGKYLDAVVNVFENQEEKKKIKNYIDNKIMKQLKKKKFDNIEQFKKLRIVLGPMELNTTDGYTLCTLGDIPISVNYFIEFMSDKVIAKDLASYPLSKFIKDVIKDLIKNFVNSEDCSGQNTSQRVSINSTTIVGYNRLENGIDTITDLCLGYLEDPKSISEYYGDYFQKGVFNLSNIVSDPNDQIFPLVKISGDRNNPITFKNIDMMTNFYVFSVGRNYPADKYVGDRDVDASAGIFHYLLGEDRGIVKNIKLQKTMTPGLKEVRFEQEGYAGLEQLREVYNASIDCYLNPQTFPGTYIYIPPEGFAPDFSMRSMMDDKGNLLDLTKFGVGGYYMITKTTHQISPGQADTSIEASWVASKDGKYGKRTASSDGRKRGEGEGSEKVKKCKISVNKNR